MLVNTTGTAIYFNIVIYNVPIGAIDGVYWGTSNPKRIPAKSPVNVNKLNLFFIIKPLFSFIYYTKKKDFIQSPYDFVSKLNYFCLDSYNDKNNMGK